ncbi:MAG TPA: phosphate signaling complex protein PhoU [Bacteroidales bacterium]|nr:phosphate signaling complex protein PhoU [Bacteroidales bacterium]HPT01007.1 phosphate signaling complex protein PhoU [Bacteroidales bacterium]
MSQLETAIQFLKNDLLQMWSLVISQMEKSRIAILEANKSLAHEVRLNEKKVDAFDLKIDMDCENILMLKNPVAIDMRFVISVLKINYNLERIGDYTNTFAKIAEGISFPWEEEVFRKTHIPEMFYLVQSMMQEAMEAFANQDKSLVNGLFQSDKKLDSYNTEAVEIIGNLIREKPEQCNDYLNAYTVIGKLERSGDHVLNIGEELIFLYDAIVIKHIKLAKGRKP